MQVAKAAGVSRTTASLVLSGKSDANRISTDTTTRVLEAARNLDYSPNLLGRSLHHGTTHAFAFFNGFKNRQKDDLYIFRLLDAVQTSAGNLGCDVLIHCDFSKPPEEMYRLMNGGRADGVLLFAPSLSDPLLPMLRQSRLPVVLLNVVDPENVLPSVRDDLNLGMQMLSQSLLDQGHKRLAYVYCPRFEGDDFCQRWAALYKFCEDKDVDLFEHPFSMHEDFGSVLRRVIDTVTPPTALIFANDKLAYKAIDTLESWGHKIPEDFSVVGYDGIRWASTTAHVVTSVMVDLPTLTQTAMNLLSSIARQELIPPKVTNVPVQFFPGTTVGPPNDNSSNGAIK